MDKTKISTKSLAESHPDLAKEWHPTKNGKLTPKDVTTSYSEKVWWHILYYDKELGKEFDLEWPATIYSRLYGNAGQGLGCPYLTGHAVSVGFNDLAFRYPELAKEWHPTKNGDLKPTDVTVGTQRKVWWYLPYDDKATGKHFDFEWLDSIAERVNGSKCPYLTGEKVYQGFNDLVTVYPDLINYEWDYEKNAPLLPTEVTREFTTSVWWKCSLGHSYRAKIKAKTSCREACPFCKDISKTSFPEQAILYYLKRFYPDAINRDTATAGTNLDIYIPSIKTAIEYDVLLPYNTQSIKDRDIKKINLCNQNGIKLIWIRVEGSELYSNCHCIEHNPNNYTSINSAIIEVFKTLGLPTNNINIKRDIQKIQQNYLQRLKEESIASLIPEIAREWDYEKNKPLSPEFVSAKSTLEYWWICPKGHNSYQDKVQARVNNKCKSGCCPVCKKESHRKAIYCVELNRTFESIREAAYITKVCPTNISNHLNGKLGSAGKIIKEDGTIIKLHWKWA